MKPTILFLLAVSFAHAQAPVPDAKGCQDSKVLSRIPGCRIMNCKVSDYDIADIRVSKEYRENKKVEGAYEFINFRCPAGTSGIQVARNSEAALKAAGYKILFTDNYSNVRFTVTAQSGPQWVMVYADGTDYKLTTVKAKALDQQMQASGADGWAQQINQTGRVSIYGINFDTGKATIRPDSEPVLTEVVTLLQKQPDWYLMVAGHTDNAGTDAVNTPLSQQRAQSVIAWLSAKGIDKARLAPAGFGARKPLADNSTEDGRTKNRRVDLIKLY
jgi:outer membrane protein OmpA-like peptidoglycan-associated protein